MKKISTRTTRPRKSRTKVRERARRKRSTAHGKSGDPASEHNSLHARIIEAIRRIPRGRVCTYGNVADVAGVPRRARLVGTILKTTSARGLPWY
jgi:methylated-DNA-protein-cysteine methyltransferase related protein